MEMFKSARVRTFEEKAKLVAEIPPEMRDRVMVVEDPTLTGSETRVRYADGVVRIEVGPEAGPMEVRGHLATAQRVERFRGPIGSVRKLLSRIGSWLRIQPGYGTKGFEAREEIQKLEGIREQLETMRADLEGTASDLSNESPMSAQQIEEKLASVNDQIAKHAEQIDSYEKGRGYIAAEATGREKAAKAGFKVEVPLPGGAGTIETVAPVIPGHYYKETAEGSGIYVLVPFDVPEGQPIMKIDYSTSPPRIVERPDQMTAAERYAKQRAEALQKYGTPDSFPELETALKGMDPANAAMIRRYRIILGLVYEGAGKEGQKKLEEIVKTMGTSEAQYRAFLRAVRAAQLEQVMSIKDPEAQIGKLRSFLDQQPEGGEGAVGELFTSYRERRLAASEPTRVQGLEDRPKFPRDVPSVGRKADGALEVTGAVEDAPNMAKGIYLVEDKAGGSFNPKQAEDYSKAFTDKKVSAKGLVYIFENDSTANDALKKIRTLDSRIGVAFFDTKGKLRFLREPVEPEPT
jgi:hypothetical protein